MVEHTVFLAELSQLYMQQLKQPSDVLSSELSELCIKTSSFTTALFHYYAFALEILKI